SPGSTDSRPRSAPMRQPRPTEAQRRGGRPTTVGEGRLLPARLSLRFPILLFLQLAPQDLARGGPGQRVDEFHHPRHLERRHAAARPVDDITWAQPALRRRLGHDDRLDGLAAVAVARADDARLLDVRMRVEERLDLGRPDLEARRIDHALQAVGDEEIAVLVVVPEVAGA